MRLQTRSSGVFGDLFGWRIVEYDISSDGKEVVFSTQPAGKASQFWLAVLDRFPAPTPPSMLSLRLPLTATFTAFPCCDLGALYRLFDAAFLTVLLR